MVSKVAHPFYPVGAEVVGYLANEHSVPRLLAIFFGACLLLFALTFAVLHARPSDLSRSTKATVFWFVLCGCIHFFFEGYFGLYHMRLARSQDLFSQLWKEYAHSDSRYMTSDTTVLWIERVTAVAWGPLSFIVAWLAATSHPLRYPLQSIVSLGQLYGNVIYYLTGLFDQRGVSYSRPEVRYFWGYFIIINFFWIVIPFKLVYDSVVASAQAFKAQDRMSALRQGNGAVKKAL